MVRPSTLSKTKQSLQDNILKYYKTSLKSSWNDHLGEGGGVVVWGGVAWGEETWIWVDGDGVGDGEGVNSRAALVVLENFVRFLCLKAYS